MKNVWLQKWDNGRPGSGCIKVIIVPDDFRPEDVTGDYDKLEIIENGRVVYQKINGKVVCDEREKGDQDMSTTRTFKDLVDEAKEQLDRGEVFERGRRLQANGKCDKTARGLQAKIDEITATYLEDVPESFDDMEIMMLYIQELREVIDELKADIDEFRRWGRRYGLTEYARAILRDADDVVKDLIFERSAAERAYDIVSAMLVHPEEEDAEKDELDLFLDMFFAKDPDGADKLREAAARLEASYEKHEP